jgi:Uri superfamily endonuclease
LPIRPLCCFATPIEVWCAISDRKLEQEWAKMLQDSPKFRTPISRFGSSDYHRTRTTHLFYSKRRPLFRWFEEKIREVFEPSIRTQQFILSASASTSYQPSPAG